MNRLTQRDCYRPNVRYEDLAADRLHRLWLEAERQQRRECYLHLFLGIVLLAISVLWIVGLVIYVPPLVSSLLASIL